MARRNLFNPALAGNLHDQNFSAFFPPAGENLATIVGPHSRPETVLAFSLFVLYGGYPHNRLPSNFHL